MIARPFAYNPTHIVISGTTLTGDLSIGVTAQDYFSKPGGLQWWMGPDESLGYIICGPIPTGNRHTPIGNIGTVHFWRSKLLTDASMLSLVTKLSNGSVTAISGIQTWLTSNGYWSSWNAPPTMALIKGGDRHSIGIDINGQVWGWGYNNSGQLGDNTIIQKVTPVSIKGMKKTFCKITVGSVFSAGIDKNGQIWGWGYNNIGQLGINSTINKCTPVSIQGAKKTFCKISVIDREVSALDKNGQVWGWGYNNFGQLGINSTTNQCTPVSIQGAKKTFCQISSGQEYIMALDKNGQVWGWGYNSNGQLGINSTINQNTPVSIQGVKKTFCKISAGEKYTIATDYTGQVWGWGYNVQGQLGDNYNTKTPIRVYDF